MTTVAQWWMWLVFLLFIFAMLIVDLYVFGARKAHKVSVRESLTWTLVWFGLSLLFNLGLWFYLKETQNLPLAYQKATEFFTGYIIEKSLSADNIFVFLMIFSYFAVPPEYQQRVLLYGIIGAIVLRACMILLGSWLVSQFHWVLYLFGIFLVFTGIKMLVMIKHPSNIANNPVLKWMQRHFKITPDFHGEKFFVKIKNQRFLTPLFLVLVLVEITDLIFAVDSIPAIFAITADPFIVFTSNIFAILGLRALYFLLSNLMGRFSLLKYGLSLMLVFIGVKMLIAHWVIIPTYVSLLVVFAILTIFILLSLLRPPSRSS
jgi:tellurite resistance protein TerC